MDYLGHRKNEGTNEIKKKIDREGKGENEKLDISIWEFDENFISMSHYYKRVFCM